MTSRDLTYLAPACLCAALLAYKIWHVRAHWRSPRVWAMWATILFATTTLLLAAPASRVWIRQLSDIPNVGTPIYLCSASASAASYLVLALFWRYPARSAVPRVRWVVLSYALADTAVAVLFALSSVPEYRPVDFGVYYADQLTVYAMMLVWLGSIMAGSLVIAWWCFSWARSDEYAELPWLRRGLRLYSAVGIAVSILTLEGLVTISATYANVQIVYDVAVAAPLIVLPAAGVLLAAALLVPVWGPRWPDARIWVSRWWDFRTLRTLHRELVPVHPGIVLVVRGRRWDPHHRVRRAVIELNDLRAELAGLFDPAVAAAAERAGRETGLSGRELRAAIEAARLKAAHQAWSQGVRPAESPSGGQGDTAEDVEDGIHIESEISWWVQVARAFDASPVVARAVGGVACGAAPPRHTLTSP